MESVLSIMKALADGNRLRIVRALMEHEELCACQLTELLQVSGATVSRHMSILLNAGLLQSRKDGRWVYYCLAQDADAELLDWLKRQSSTTPSDCARLVAILKADPEELCRKQRGADCCP